MKETLCLSTLLLSSCPKVQSPHGEMLDFSQEPSQILTTYLRLHDLHSSRYKGLYAHTYESVQGPVTAYYKPEGIEVLDTYIQDELFLTDEEYFHDLFILASSHPPRNYVDFDVDGTIDYIVDSSGESLSYTSLSSAEQEQHTAYFELLLLEFVETLRQQK